MIDLAKWYPLDALGLPNRVRNALLRAGITTPEELATQSEAELLALRGFGATALTAVQRQLAAWQSPSITAAAVESEAVLPLQEPESEPALPRGRRVLHAGWLPGPPGQFFLWGEGEPQPSPTAGNAASPLTPIPTHPFHLPPTILWALLEGQLSGGATSERRRIYLPTVGGTPQPSPQLIAEELGESEEAPSLQAWEVDGLVFSPLATLALLNNLPAEEELGPRLALGADLLAWSLAGKLAVELLARQEFAPTLERDGDVFQARWVPVLHRSEDLQRIEQLAQAMPVVGRALAVQEEEGPPTPPAARALLKDLMGAMVDAAVRAWALPLPRVVTRRDSPTLQAWLSALFGSHPVIDAPLQELEKLHGEVAQWLEQLLAGAEEPFRICFRLEPPALPEETAALAEAGLVSAANQWTLRFLLQARDDPSLLIPATMVWRERGSTLRYLDRRFENPQEKLLLGLGQAARFFAPLQNSLRAARPEFSLLDTEEAYTFLRETAPLLEQSGFGVLVPQWWKKRQKRLGVRVTVVPSDGAGKLNMESLVRFRWQLALGDQSIDPDEFAHLAALKQPLVQVRGEWVELQPEQVEAAIRFWEKRATEEEMALRDVLRLGLVDEAEIGELPVVGIEAQGWVDELLQQMAGSEALRELEPPQGLNGQLRPYQVRGLSWLAFLRRWGLGACLADDMGLGKTIQTIALILDDLEKQQAEGTVLIVCPTSVVGNWSREMARFAPSLRVLVHHGSDRASGQEFVQQARQHNVVISSYALVRRDEQLLREVSWGGLVLDEAQNIKNPATKQTQAIRGLSAGYRVALTGTPVENRLTELWSIMQFLNPGYLGSQQSFRSRFALPIERYRDREAAARLRQLVQPFILRRVKTDPTIIQDLPDKLEAKIYCTLTQEQATLYQAVVQEALKQVDEAKGIQRKGLVLSMLTRLKQICNHPAHFLGDGSALAERSGKLARLGEMLEEVLTVNERALIFTQFAEMGSLLQDYLEELFGDQVLFLHGGTPARQRDRMIERFQQERHGPAIFVLSLKAGGLGLNLTRANHVFHYDRWWNPAVENQATDRAFRIGQTKDVWVHKFLCAGTLEERIDELIESKKALAESVIGAGEGWLTELSIDQLRELVVLDRKAIGE